VKILSSGGVYIMRRLTLHLALGLLTFIIGISASAVWRVTSTPIDKGQRARADEQELLQMEQDYINAERRADVEFFDRIYASDFYLTGSDGTVLNREQALEEISASKGLYKEMYHSDVQVQLYGDTAVVTGRWRGKIGASDGDTTEQTRWTDMFVRRDGRWLLASTHVTSIDDSEGAEE
jgi:ketosteroid isomerase-like protein